MDENLVKLLQTCGFAEELTDTDLRVWSCKMPNGTKLYFDQHVDGRRIFTLSNCKDQPVQAILRQ